MAREVIYTAKIGIEGITPLLMHKCGVIENKRARSAATNYEDEWKKGTYISMETKTACAPAINLEAMLRDASKGYKIKKVYQTKIITAGLEVVEFEPLVAHENKPFTIEDIEKNGWLFSCAVVIKKDRVMRTRTCIPPGWKVIFHAKVMNPLLEPSILEETIARAGYEQGLMDWRPGSKSPGKFGQFELFLFEVKKD